jgi:hypothetical protein
MPIMLGNRNDVVRTTAGHTVAFSTGEETFVPDNNAVVKACIERGHTLKKEDPTAKEPPKTTVKASTDK